MALILSGDTGPSIVQSAAMPSGSVLQVVNGSTTTGISTTSSTYVDTNLTATITPRFISSKILILISQSGISVGTSASGVNCRILRDSTQLIQFAMYYMYSTTGAPVGASANYLDSPATTSAITYKTQYQRGTGSGYVYMNDNNATSTITLLEISG